MARRPRHPSAGFTLTELMVVVSVFTIMVGIAVPTTINVTEAVRLNGAAREFERELQAARLKAVQSNRALRIRFNCPTSRQYRRVEVMNAALDSASDRCLETRYPFPSTRDGDPSTPAHDGPVRYMPEGLMLVAGAQAVEFRPDGRAFQVSGSTVQAIGAAGLQLTLQKGAHTMSVNVNGLGRVEIQ